MSVLLLLALSAATLPEKSATCDAKPFTFGAKKVATVAPHPPPPPKPAPPPKPKVVGVAPCKTPK